MFITRRLLRDRQINFTNAPGRLLEKNSYVKNVHVNLFYKNVHI